MLDSSEEISAEQMYDELSTNGWTARSELRAFGVKRRAKTRRRRTAQPPAQPVPFFAPRTGLIPRAGRPTIAGRRMPTGQRNPDTEPAYWISDEPVNEALGMADGLAQAFAETGIWPLLWTYGDERFAAVLIAVQPSLALVSVAAPPHDEEQTLNLAAEIWAFCPPPEAGRPNALREIAAMLSGSGHTPNKLGAEIRRPCGRSAGMTESKAG